MTSTSSATGDRPARIQQPAPPADPPYRILVPISGEAQAFTVIPLVARIALAEKGEVVLFHFVRAAETEGEDVEPEPPAWLASAAKLAAQRGARARMVVRAGQDSI